MDFDMNIIGIVGPLACGKGVIAEYLIKKYKYTSFSLSTLVHAEVKKRGFTSVTRTILQDVGDDMRVKEGDGVLAKRAIKQLIKNNNQLTQGKNKIIIEGIRNPGEVEYLRSIPGFFLIAVDAKREVRFQRVLKRGKPWDPQDWKTFLTVDMRDSKGADKTNGQQVRKCMSMADINLQNDTDPTHIYEMLEQALSTRRPLYTER